MIHWLLQQAATQPAPAPAAGPIDSHVAVDSAVVVSPLPGGVAAVFRWIFNRPQWLQIGGIVVGVLVAAVVLVYAWRHRRRIVAWVVGRPHGWKVAAATAVGVVALAGVGGGAATWNYVQHDNGFCVSCHVMTPAFSRFQTSEHKKLECHDCHRQSIFASAQELYYWVAERPEKIPPHAKVPTKICSECHIQDDPDSTWKRISATAGHRLHLESDSSALAKVQCVTCHGVELHRFASVDETCSQSGCHVNIEIKLGKMRDQTSLHCTGCHAFARDVSEQIPLDSARRELVPREAECLSCHAMKEKLADFDANRDPHKATCGACHNPHVQESPKAAFESCATSGCHAGADTLTPFHRGITAAQLARCGDCHAAHQWTIEEKTCITCHADVMRDGAPARRAARTAAAPRATDLAPAPDEARGPGAVLRPIAWHGLDAPSVPVPAAVQGTAQAPPADFSHRRHRDVSCTRCHSMARTHGELTVRTPRDCQSCHHDLAKPAAACTACHSTGEIAATRRDAQPMRLTVWREPRTRPLPFDHDQHRSQQCTTCHVQPLTLAVARTCTSCHAQHHEPTRTCTACHVPPKQAHTRAAHLGCAGSGCHSDQVSPTLAATRSTCLTCHVEMKAHKPGKQCAACHQVSWQTHGARGATE
jgi:nitrate/TMAO reductase-like tetraheme cytochrome c subunit